MTSVPITAVLVFGAVALLAYLLLSMAFSEERRVSRVLRDMPAYEAAEAQQAEPLLQPFFERVLRPGARWLIAFAKRMGPSDLRQGLQRRLVQAGNPSGIDADGILALKIVSALIVLGVDVLLALANVFSGLTMIALGAVTVGLGFMAPDVWLHGRVERRQKAARRALPEMLDMLTISVEAGLGFDQGLAKLVRNSEGPLAEEFGRMLQEVQAGVARKDALRHLVERLEVPELNTFVMALIQADVFGISISKVLKTQAKEIRLRRRQHAEEMAQKLPVKIVFPVVICILPATLLVVVGPAALAIGKAFGIIQ